MAPATLSSDEEWADVRLARAGESDKDVVILAMAQRIFAAHEIIGKRAERREWRLTETDYCPLG